MKTKKVLWGFLIAIFIIGCATDDFEAMEENVEVDSEFNINKSQTNDDDDDCECQCENEDECECECVDDNQDTEEGETGDHTDTLSSTENDPPESRGHPNEDK